MEQQRISAERHHLGRPLRERATPETLRLRGAWPTFTVSDLARSLSFYRDTLGFVVDEIWKREGRRVAASLIAGRVRLMLVESDDAAGPDDAKVAFRLYLTTIQDIDLLAHRIETRGGRLEGPPAEMPWGGRAFTILDPDGFRLTISTEA